MKYILIFTFFLMLKAATLPGQPMPGENPVLKKLDSVKNSTSVAKHFAGLYYTSSVNLHSFISGSSFQDSGFVLRMESSFLLFFLEAAVADKNQKKVPEPWRVYFSHPALSELQFKLAGANAHINGDLWQALCHEFNSEEIKRNKKGFINLNPSFRNTYRMFFNDAAAANKKVAVIQKFSLGLGKWYGWLMMKRWRKRQVKLAILYYENPYRFVKKEKAISKKKQRIDRLILRKL